MLQDSCYKYITSLGRHLKRQAVCNQSLRSACESAGLLSVRLRKQLGYYAAEKQRSHILISHAAAGTSGAVQCSEQKAAGIASCCFNLRHISMEKRSGMFSRPAN